MKEIILSAGLAFSLVVCGSDGRYAGPASRVAPKHVIVVGFDGLAALLGIVNPPVTCIGRPRHDAFEK